MKTHILLADDHRIVLEGFSSIISNLPGLEIVGLATNGIMCLEMVYTFNPDVLVLDINMPGKNGFEVTAELKKTKPELKIIILSMLNDLSSARQMIQLDIDGYLLKNCDKKTLKLCLDTVISGGKYYDGEIFEHLKNNFESKLQLEHEEIKLSKREVEIIEMVAQGKQNHEIAELLFLSIHTVKTHRKNINFKLGIHTPMELVLFAKENGIIK